MPRSSNVLIINPAIASAILRPFEAAPTIPYINATTFATINSIATMPTIA